MPKRYKERLEIKYYLKRGVDSEHELAQKSGVRRNCVRGTSRASWDKPQLSRVARLTTDSSPRLSVWPDGLSVAHSTSPTPYDIWRAARATFIPPCGRAATRVHRLRSAAAPSAGPRWRPQCPAKAGSKDPPPSLPAGCSGLATSIMSPFVYWLTLMLCSAAPKR